MATNSPPTSPLTRWEDLSAAVQRKARMCLADNLGATLAGTLTHVSRISADYAVEAWGGDQATILRHEPGLGLHGLRASMPGAAFANANAANGLDLDDSARYAYGHAGGTDLSGRAGCGRDAEPYGR